MSWLARLRAWLAGSEAAARRAPSGTRRGTTGALPARRGTIDPDLAAFLASRRGVEAFVEPATTIHGRSVLLVAADGEFLRRPVPDLAALERACHARGVPVYDAARVGYPRRLREHGRAGGPGTVELSDLPPWPGEGPGGQPPGPARPRPDRPEEGPPPPPTTGPPPPPRPLG